MFVSGTLRTVVLPILCGAMVVHSGAARAQARGHMPETVPGKLVRELLSFSPTGLFPTDTLPPELYLDPVPSRALPVQLPEGLRPAAAMRNAVGRVLFFPRGSSPDALVERLAKHLEVLGWRRDDTNLLRSRELRAGEGIYCRRNSTVMLVADTADDGYVMLTRFTPLMSTCGQFNDSIGRVTPFFPTLNPPPGSSGASFGSTGSGVEQTWHADVRGEIPVPEFAAHYSAALEKHGLHFGPLVMRGDTLTRSARWERDETTWTGEFRAMIANGRRRVELKLRRELDPDERY